MPVLAIQEESTLTVRNLSVTFPTESGALRALKSVSFQVMPHEFLAVIGPSGSGKSTLLRVLAGLLLPTTGEIVFGASKLPRIGMVFQDATLMPWRTVLRNITLPLEVAGISRKERLAKAQRVVDLVELGGFEHSWPRQLSGGMAQRVAIARALVHDPELLLLDEPFASLDALTREDMGSELSRIWEARRSTVVLVTHSIGEALFLADRVVVLSARPGTIRLDVKVDIPRPRNDRTRYTPQFAKMAMRLKESLDLDLQSYR